VVVDVSTATQADAADAYLETYGAWEGCAVNMENLKTFLNEKRMIENR
jgi:hypothetical protein